MLCHMPCRPLPTELSGTIRPVFPRGNSLSPRRTRATSVRSYRSTEVVAEGTRALVAARVFGCCRPLVHCSTNPPFLTWNVAPCVQRDFRLTQRFFFPLPQLSAHDPRPSPHLRPSSAAETEEKLGFQNSSADCCFTQSSRLSLFHRVRPRAEASSPAPTLT